MIQAANTRVEYSFDYRRINNKRVLVIKKRLYATASNNANNDDDNSSLSSNHDLDASNGYELDRSAEVARTFSNDRVGLANYFEEKENSIKSQLETDIANTQGTEFETEEYIGDLKENAATLLTELENSKDTIYDLMPAFPQDSSDVEREDFTSAPDEDEC